MKHFRYIAIAKIIHLHWIKRVIYLFFLLTTILLSNGKASAQSGKGWNFSDGTLTITADDKDGGWWTAGINSEMITEIVLTDNVTKIEEREFQYYKDLERITIGSNVKTIGSYALAISKLTSIQFDKNSLLTTIGSNAFSGSAITTITIPASVETIDDVAFSSCNNLESVNFEQGSKLKKMERAFWMCSKLKTITIPASVETMHGAFHECEALETVYFEVNSNLKEITNSFYKTSIQKITIPASVETIDDYAFYYCKNLETVSFESGSCLKTIGTSSFAESGLKSIIIPASIESIGRSAIAQCPDFESVQFESNSQLKEIGPYAFFELPLINSIHIPASTETIGENAFQHCTSLTSIQFENNSLLKTIENNAFSYCGLIEIKLPTSLQTIGNYAFSYCEKLTSIQFEENSELKTIGNYSIFRNKIQLITLPEGLQSIGEGALNENELATISIPASVTYIGTSAFVGNKLKTATFKGATPPTFDNVAIFSREALTDIFVPEGATEYYNILAPYRDLIRYALPPTPPLNPCILDNDSKYTLYYSTKDGWAYAVDEDPTRIPFSGTLTGSTNKEVIIKETTAGAALIFESNTFVSKLTIAENTILQLNGNVSIKTLQNEGILLLSEKAEITGDAISGFKKVTIKPANQEGEESDVVGTIDVSIPNSGIKIIDGSQVSLSPGTQITITATPKENYDVESVTIGGNNAIPSMFRSSAKNYLYKIIGNEENLNIVVKFKNTSVSNPEPDPNPDSTPTIFYTVTLPATEGAIVDPVAGDYEIEAWSSFRFYLTLDKDYDQSIPVVTTDRGETITPRSSDGAYIVKYVRTDMEIFIDGIIKNPAPVANEKIETNHPKVWKTGNELHIQAVTDEPGYIYTPDGKLQTVCHLIAGEVVTVRLPDGIYFVRVGKERFKIVL